MLEIGILTSRKPEMAKRNASFQFTNLALFLHFFSPVHMVFWPFDLVFSKVYVSRKSIILKMVCQESFSYDWNYVTQRLTFYRVEIQDFQRAIINLG